MPLLARALVVVQAIYKISTGELLTTSSAAVPLRLDWLQAVDLWDSSKVERGCISDVGPPRFISVPHVEKGSILMSIQETSGFWTLVMAGTYRGAMCRGLTSYGLMQHGSCTAVARTLD